MGRAKKLSRHQVLAAINRWLQEHGVPPSIEELRQALGLGSKRTVLRYLEWLEEAGDIQRTAGVARALKPLRAADGGLETRLVPIIGHAPAGPLMLAEENRQGWVQVPKSLAPSSARYFLLRVWGDSMNRAKVAGETIDSGDLVLVRQQPTADPGQIVVALIDGEATIKRLAAGQGYWVLKPESSNRKHHPIVVDREFHVQGIVVRVLKRGSSLIA